MKVTLLGFQLTFPKSELTNPEQFYGYLKSPAGNTVGDQILAACDTRHLDRDWIGGVLIRDRDAKRIAVKEKLGKKFVVKPHDLGKDTTATDFNFFVYHPITGRGLYQAYHHSVTGPQFLKMLDVLYRRHKAAKFVQKQEADTLADSQLEKLRKDAAKHLEGSIIVRREELPKLLDELDRIQSIEMEYSSYTPAQADPLTGLAAHALHHTHRLSFAKDAGRIVKNKAAEMFSQIKWAEDAFKKLRFRGVTPGGLEQVYALASNPDKFGEDDHDEWVQEIELDSSAWAASLQKTRVIKRLLHVTEEKRVKAALLTPVK